MKENTFVRTELYKSKGGWNDTYMRSCVEEAKRIKDQQNNRTNVQAAMSSWHVWDETPIYRPILQTVLELADHLGVIGFPAGSEADHETFVESAWVARYNKGDYTKPHNHAAAMYSFVVFLQAEPNDAPIIFHTHPEIKVHPESRMILLFPSYLMHSVPKQIQDRERIVLAGNLHIKRTVTK
jgi:hypothetical protein